MKLRGPKEKDKSQPGSHDIKAISGRSGSGPLLSPLLRPRTHHDFCPPLPLIRLIEDKLSEGDAQWGQG